MRLLRMKALSILLLFLAVASVPSNRYVLDTAHRTVRRSSYEPVTLGWGEWFRPGDRSVG